MKGRDKRRKAKKLREKQRDSGSTSSESPGATPEGPQDEIDVVDQNSTVMEQEGSNA